MKILLTGANGYIGHRLLPSLLAAGHEIVCLVRSKSRLRVGSHLVEPGETIENLQVIEADLLNISSCDTIPKDIDIAYYLVHSMSSSKDFASMESLAAKNFLSLIEGSQLKQIIYLSGIVNDNNLSLHLSSRLNVESILRTANCPLTVLRAAIIIGSGSASFEIIRDLVEKLPIMIAPKWLEVKCQPIGIRDVVRYLIGVMNKELAFGKVFDIGGPDILTYREMLLRFAKVRKLKRWIITVPVMTPRLSSYWLYIITSTNYSLARSLVESLRNEVICQKHGIDKIVKAECMSYEDTVRNAFHKINNNSVLSSWTDAHIKSVFQDKGFMNLEVPEHGCLFDEQVCRFDKKLLAQVQHNIWSIGGEQGWYHMDWAWGLRGMLDKLFGGVGLRRWRRDPHQLRIGDAIDFWRVLATNEEKTQLILYAEMKLPGEAWLEFEIKQIGEDSFSLKQKASFRPHGLRGRLYWYLLIPSHFFIFRGMIKKIIKTPADTALTRYNT